MRGRHRRGIAGTPLRRRLLFGATASSIVAGVGIATTSLVWGGDESAGLETSSKPVAGPPPEPGPPGPHLQISAHPDDDLYFYNLDTQRAIAGGHPIVNVCMTCGESNGRNGPYAEFADYQAFAAARQNGQRSAYAVMAGQDMLAKWDRKAVKLDSGVTVEIATLSGGVDVTMIYLDMWEDSTKQEGSAGKRLMDLWTGDSTEHHTMIPTGSPLKKNSVFTRESLLATLAEILKKYRPALVRTLDPDPDPQVHDDAHPQYADQPGFSDHADHTAAGLFAWAALTDDPAADDAVGITAEAYRGYYNRRWPRNLGEAARQDKGRYLDIYSWKDERQCGDASGCGDLRVTGWGVGDTYGPSTTYRYPADTGWLRTDTKGRLMAMSVHAGRTVHWAESPDPDDAWVKTISADDPWLLPVVHLTPSGKNTWKAFAISATYAPQSAQQQRELLVTDVTRAGVKGQWKSLGNPDAGAGDPAAPRSLGIPVAAALPDGGTVVAVRNYARQVSIARRGADDKWQSWRPLDGPIIQDGLAIAATADKIEIFGSGTDAVVYWSGVGEKWDSGTLPGVVPAGPPTFVPLPDGGALVLVREADTAEIVGWTRETASKKWGEAIRLGGDGGFGAVAAIAPDSWQGKVALAARNDDATTSLAIIDLTAAKITAEWEDSGPLVAHCPSLAVDDSGRLVVSVVTVNGELHLARQKEPAVGLPTQWRVGMI